MRPQKHPDVVSVALPDGEANAITNPCDAPDDEASARINTCDWEWPSMPNTNALGETINTVQRKIDQCTLVCRQTSGKEKKNKMIRRRMRLWRHEKH